MTPTKWKLDFKAELGTRGGPRQAELWIYDVIGDPFMGTDALSVLYQLRWLEADEILVRINSIGGVVDHGFDIYNMLSEHPAKKIVRISGVCASIATVVACAASPGCVQMYANSNYMIHEPYADGIDAPLRVDDLIKNAGVLAKIRGRMLDTYAKRTGKSVEELQALCAAETWMTADEAKALGFVDEVLGGADESDSDSSLAVAARAWSDQVLGSYKKTPPRLVAVARALAKGTETEAAPAPAPDREIDFPPPEDAQMDLLKLFKFLMLARTGKTAEDRAKALTDAKSFLATDEVVKHFAKKSDDLKALEAELAAMTKAADDLEKEAAGMSEAAKGYEEAKKRAEKAEGDLEELKKKVEALKAADEEGDEEDDSDDDDEEAKKAVKKATKAELRRVVRVAMDATGVKQLDRLESSVMLLKHTAATAPSAKDVRKAEVERLINDKKIAPSDRYWAMTTSREELDRYLAARKGAPVVAAEQTPNANAPEVVRARAEQEVELTKEELEVCRQFNNDPQKYLAAKRKALAAS